MPNIVDGGICKREDSCIVIMKVRMYLHMFRTTCMTCEQYHIFLRFTGVILFCIVWRALEVNAAAGSHKQMYCMLLFVMY